uniref:Uncharacterized protein n=1 Tax=Arundo donax TaxID=35708 RepID=A0A0A9AWP5_ARUDO
MQQTPEIRSETKKNKEC